VAESDAPDAPDAGEAVAEIRAEEFGTTEREDWSNGTEGDDFDGIRETPSGASASGSDGDDTDAQDRRGSADSLQDHLRAQIAGMRLGGDDRAALEVLIESLDGDGYLADPLLEIAERLAEMLGVTRAKAATICWAA
jgi:RNA polymerase sigma-54 factor